MKIDLIIFDFAGTLVKMRPPTLLINRSLLKQYSKKYQLAIVTGGKRTETINILNKLNICELFRDEYIITKDDTRFRKPAPELLRLVVKKAGTYSPLYIGDTARDRKMAQSAGIPFIYSQKLLLSKGNMIKVNALQKTKKRVAIFIDAANFEVSLRSLKVKADFGKIGDYFGSSVVLKTYYSVDFKNSAQGRLFTYLKHHDFKLITKPVKLIRRRGSNNLRKANFDVEISFDSAMLKDNYDTLALLSGDSDFVYMVQQLQKLGKRVVVVSPQFRTAKELRKAADKFVDLKDVPFVAKEKGPLWARKDNLSTAQKSISRKDKNVKY